MFDYIFNLLAISFVLNLFLIFFLFKNKSRTGKIFLINILSVLTWIVAIVFYRSATQENVIFYTKLLYLAATFTAPTYLYFSVAYSNFLNDLSLKKLKYFLILYNLFIGILTLFSTLIIQSATKVISSENHIEFGSLYFIYVFYILSLFSTAFYVQIKKYFSGSNLEKKQIGTYFFGSFLAANIAFATNLILPWIGYFNLNWLGQVVMIIMTASTTYGIFKYRFMDIRLVIRRSLVFTILVLIITALFSGSTVLFSTYISSFLGSKSVVMSGIITGVFVAVGFEPLKKLLTKMTDSILFKGQVDHAIALSEASQQIGSLLDLKKLSKVIEDTAYKVLKFSKLKIYIFNERTSQFSLVHKVGDGGEKDLTEENIVLQYYDEYDKTRGPKRLLVLDEVRYEYSQNKVEFLGKLIAYMEEHNLAVVAPLYIKEVALGFIFFGERKSGDPYSNEDLNFLRVLAGQAGVSFENAKLYDEQKQFTVKLQQEVDRATAELRSANKELKKLDQAKSEFISIASHQLRTPMTVIKGYMSMVESGDFGAVPEKMNKPVHSVSESASRLLALIEDLLNISRIESGRMAYEYEKANIKTMVESVYDELGQHAKKKGLEFVYYPPKFEVPDIVMDPKKIREVVMNLADNAIKYTDKGVVELHLEAKKDEITYFVKDSGRGLSKEDIGKLFKKFSRVGSAQLVHTEGTGLGLYIAKQIIKKHGGKIWAESQGAGKGSVFALSLKIKNPELDALLKEQQKTAIAQSGKKEQYMEDTIDTSRIRK